jgi:hypothetical protein
MLILFFNVIRTIFGFSFLLQLNFTSSGSCVFSWHQSSKMATALVHPALPPFIFAGKQATLNP